MVISHRHKFIFIKTTKTAGTSLEVFLSNVCGDEDVFTPIIPHVEPHRPRNFESQGFFNHMPGQQIARLISPEIWDNYFKFCVERNPWDKTLSHYHMVKNYSKTPLSLGKYFQEKFFPKDFPKYTNKKGKILVDKIIRYETLDQELSSLFADLGIPFNGTLGIWAKSTYRTDYRNYREVLTSQQAAEIAFFFSQEINLLGYEF